MYYVVVLNFDIRGQTLIYVGKLDWIKMHYLTIVTNWDCNCKLKKWQFCRTRVCTICSLLSHQEPNKTFSLIVWFSFVSLCWHGIVNTICRWLSSLVGSGIGKKNGQFISLWNKPLCSSQDPPFWRGWKACDR